MNWQVENLTPFATGHFMDQDWNTGAKLWRVAIKATFDIGNDGSLSISKNQPQVNSLPVYSGEESFSSLLYESDLSPLKEKVDIILNASAYAPANETTTEWTVSVSIGDWRKSLKIIGDRKWKKVLGILTRSYPAPFQKIPINYEKAYGGMIETAPEDSVRCDPRNPVGTGFRLKRSDLRDQALPNVEYHQNPTGKSPKRNKIAGFGAIPGHWEPRLSNAGTYDEQWRENRFPFLPNDLNTGYFQHAPEDQRLSDIKGKEKVRLNGLTPEGALSFEIPSLAFRLLTDIDGETVTQPALIQTLIIEPDLHRLSMIFAGELNVDKREYRLKKTVVSINSLTYNGMPYDQEQSK